MGSDHGLVESWPVFRRARFHGPRARLEDLVDRELVGGNPLPPGDGETCQDGDGHPVSSCVESEHIASRVKGVTAEKARTKTGGTHCVLPGVITGRLC